MATLDRWTFWRCIPYWRWWFSIAMLVYWEWKDDDLLDVRDYNPLEILTKKSWHKNLKLPNAINLLFSLGSLGSGATGSWNLIHQKFQVPNAGFPEPFLGYYGGWVFPYIGRIHTAYIGEDSLHFRHLKCLVIDGLCAIFKSPSYFLSSRACESCEGLATPYHPWDWYIHPYIGLILMVHIWHIYHTWIQWAILSGFSHHTCFWSRHLMSRCFAGESKKPTRHAGIWEL